MFLRFYTGKVQELIPITVQLRLRLFVDKGEGSRKESGLLKLGIGFFSSVYNFLYSCQMELTKQNLNIPLWVKTD